MQKIKQVMYDFYNSTGINIVLLRDDFSYVGDRNHWESNCYCKAIQNTRKGYTYCEKSDSELLKKCKSTKKMQMHVCYGGLIDMALPIIYDDNIIGYIIFGQMRSEVEFSKVVGFLKSLGLDEKELQVFFDKIPVYNHNKIQSISNIATMLVKYILLEKLLMPYMDDRIQSAINYIESNLEGELSIQKISKSVNVSKSFLYKNFHKYFNCTISEYINTKRIEKSLEYLKEPNLSIDEVSQKVGFSSVSYYGKIFKQQKNMTPFKYKKNCILKSDML